MNTKNFVWYWNVIHYSVYQFLKRQSFTRPTIHAGGFMGALVMSLGWSVFNFCQLFSKSSLSDWVLKNEANELMFLAILTFLAFLFNHLLLFKNDIYVNYFEEFDEMDSGEKSKYFWVSSITVLLICVVFIYSFKYCM